ncbi:MAG TPA: TetR/AcrR family transcriptional regulator [Desulfomonilaceae bacterium]|nr:TetR/AcrR family transcriptional regulator [Desulfomonilaceae bacterium]
MKKNAAAPPSTAPQHAQDSQRIDVPPGGVKIMEALRLLLQEKSFDAITTAEISKVAGANEALIYRYFKDKRGLLHKVLAEYTLDHLLQIRTAVNHVQGALNKLRQLMKGTISFHKKNRVFSQILLLDVRNYPGYFDSDAYELVKQYARLIDEIVEEGIRNNEIREDVSMACVKDVIVGSIEHACLRSVVFKREFDEELLARNLTETVIGGLAKPTALSRPAEDGKDLNPGDRTCTRMPKTTSKKRA